MADAPTEPVQRDRGSFWAALRQVRRLLPFMGDLRSSIGLLLISLVMVAVASMPMPFLFKSIIDHALPREDVPVLIGIVVALLAARLLHMFFDTLGAYLLAACGQRVAFRLRQRIFERYLNLPYATYLETPPGSMVNRVVSDTQAVANFIGKTLWVAPLPFIIVSVGTAVMFAWHPILALYVLLTIPATMLLTKRLGRKLRHLHQDQRDQQEGFQGAVGDVVDNIRVVRSLASEERFDKELGQSVDAFGNFSMRRSFLSSSLRSSNRIIETAFKYLFIIFGAYLVIVDQLTLGEFFAFKFFQEMLGPQVNSLYNYLTELPNDTVAVERTLAVLEEDCEPGLDNPRRDPADVLRRPHVRFDHVSFVYPDGTAALHDISFVVPPGESLALVGPSGSGKSTITSLLLGLYRPTSGAIYVDGRDVTEWHPTDLRSVVGMIYQEAVLFDRSVRENLQVAYPEANDEECWEALRIAHAAEFVRECPQGLDTIIGSRGVKLSGGQRQRLSIARAVINNPPLLVLDEATSALDSISERAIQEAIAEISVERTTIMIAHRLSTIAHADNIVVLEHGRVVEQGRHFELLASKGLYRTLYDSQVDGFLADHDEFMAGEQA